MITSMTDLRGQLSVFVSICSTIMRENEDYVMDAVDKIEKMEFGNELHGPYLQRWYDSLRAGKPDYTMYLNSYYLIQAWLSWKHYCRKYIKFIEKHLDFFPDVNTVIDYGCGIGFSTLMLEAVFKDALIYGTNIPLSLQYRFCELLLKYEPCAFIKPHVVEKLPRACDLAFCSEYFEHFERPIEHLRDIVQHNSPRIFLIANAFGAKAVGHFNTYYDGRSTYAANEIGRAFSAELKQMGYCKLKHDGWNNRPSIYIKEEVLQGSLLERR